MGAIAGKTFRNHLVRKGRVVSLLRCVKRNVPGPISYMPVLKGAGPTSSQQHGGS
jgi:hypothetical protein